MRTDASKGMGEDRRGKEKVAGGGPGRRVQADGTRCLVESQLRHLDSLCRTGASQVRTV